MADDIRRTENKVEIRGVPYNTVRDNTAMHFYVIKKLSFVISMMQRSNGVWRIYILWWAQQRREPSVSASAGDDNLVPKQGANSIV